MSSVPIQFLVYVYSVPSCTLKPILISDLNNDDCQAAGVGANFNMTLTAINRCGSGRTITDIATLSFPITIKSALTQDSTNASPVVVDSCLATHDESGRFTSPLRRCIGQVHLADVCDTTDRSLPLVPVYNRISTVFEYLS